MSIFYPGELFIPLPLGYHGKPVGNASLTRSSSSDTTFRGNGIHSFQEFLTDLTESASNHKILCRIAIGELYYSELRLFL